MKKQNKIYLPLKEQGIKKAWDKVTIFSAKKDTGYSGCQMVIYWQNKPFCYWSVKDATDVKDLKLTLCCMLDYYSVLSLNSRRQIKRNTKYFIDHRTEYKVATYKRGGVIFPEV